MAMNIIYSISNQPWMNVKILGRGAYGIVSKIRPIYEPILLPSLMAVKSSIETNSLVEEQMLLMFKHHPNIIRCYGSEISHVTTKLGDTIPMYNIFLEYASDGCLIDEIEKTEGQGLSEKRVSEFLKGMLLGLKEIHKAGVIHCDIKPGNILIANGVPKIADFGLAIKTTDIVLGKRGTNEYMAPEIIADEVYTSAADIWSLGCTVLMMLNGKNVWGEPFKREMMRFIGAYDVIPKIPNELSVECKDFLQRCFIRDFRRRWSAELLLCHPFLFKQHENMIKFKKPTYLDVLRKESKN